ncbi:putative transposase YbfD/YdcC [Streptomyces sp. BK208]|nr:putative transposase YbfD/YdcC [Streptomyces sp. BK208]
MIAQRQVAAKSNETPAFAPLLDRIDLRGVVVTADAMHTQRAHAEHVIAASGHYLLVVKGNQKKLRKQLRRLPWRQIPLQARTTGSRHGRREVRRMKVCTVRPGLFFPHAVQVMEIKRRRAHRKTGRVETKSVYAITSLPPEQAGAAQLAELVQNHWSVEALHHVRDVTFGEDAPAPHPAPWPPCATSPSDSCAKQAGPTSLPQPITIGHALITLPPCSDSQPENASPLH